MSELFFELLQKILTDRHHELEFVFWHRYFSRKHGERIDGPYTSLSKMTEHLCKRAGVEKFGLHQLRHLSSAILKNDGKMSIAQMQLFLRHSQQRTTEIYAGFLEIGTQVQADYLGKFWSGKLSETNEKPAA
jgi:integrase